MKQKFDNGIHTIHRDYPRNPEGKNYLCRASPLSLFLSLHYIKCLQYNIRFQPTSETLIPIPELEIDGPKNPIPWIAKPLTIILPKTTQKNYKCKEYNINPTFSHLLFSLHTGRTIFQINNLGQKCPLLLYTKRTS